MDLLQELADDISFSLQAIEDDSRRDKAEIALKQSEIRYHSLFEQANDAVFLETLDGRILDVNRKACQMLGYTRDELLALTVPDLLPPDGRDNLQFVNDALKQGKSFYIEGKNLKSDGSTIDVETSISGMKIDDKLRILTLVRNISEKNQARAQMERLQKRFESVIENTPMVAIQGFDASGKIIHWNHESERIYGFTKENALGKNIQDLIFNNDSRVVFKAQIKQVLKSGIPSQYNEWQTISANGNRHWVLSTIFPVFEKKHNSRTFLCGS